VIYLGVNPIPVLFIFLAMVLACTTIIEWVLDTWRRYAMRIRLEGGEQVIYAHPPSQETRPQDVDVEKRGEMAES
jgi:hypothetical protein